MWEVLKNTQLWFGGSSHPYANGFKLRLKELAKQGAVYTWPSESFFIPF